VQCQLIARGEHTAREVTAVERFGFQLIAELGQGSFGRVYLAKQGELAGRLVVLKISEDLTAESHSLAQLQHTNIVPVYSVHRSGAVQAVCMPYFGPTTLADVLEELKSRSSLPLSGSDLLSTLNNRKTVLAPA
jgi:serine/threonine protein kinase